MLLALAIVASFGTVGNLLVFAFLIAPPATATLLVRRVPAIMVVGVAARRRVRHWSGCSISYHHATAAGATMALCTVIVFFAALIDALDAAARRPPPPTLLVRSRSAGTLRTWPTTASRGRRSPIR